MAIGALAFGSQAAQAGLICTGCEYDAAADGTYVGLYNPQTFDFGTFQHSDVGIDNGPSTSFHDFWVFDVNPAGHGSISADFTAFTSISGFTGQLFADGGSTCAGSTCSNIVTGAWLATENSVDRRWEIMANGLEAGRYILLVTGTTNSQRYERLYGAAGLHPGAGHASAARPGPVRSRLDATQNELSSSSIQQRARPRAGLFVPTRQIFASSRRA